MVKERRRELEVGRPGGKEKDGSRKSEELGGKRRKKELTAEDAEEGEKERKKNS